MTEIIRVINDKPDHHIRIEFMVSNVCNYQCRYCDPHAYGGDFRWTNDTDLLIKNFKHLLKFYKDNGKRSAEINLLGGEPTLWPDLGKFVKSLKDEFDIAVTMTSNGSRTIRWWKANAKLFDKIMFSYQPEFADRDHYINVVDTVFAMGIPCNALIMMDPANWETSVSMVEKCKAESKENWFISAMEVHSEIKYTEEQKNYFEKHDKRRPNIFRILKDEMHQLIMPSPKVVLANGKTKKIDRNWISVNGLNNFEGWMCNIGIENINIQKDGIITGTCLEIPFGEENYYNIYDKDFSKNFNPTLQPVKCTKTGCYCQPEMLMNKFKPV